MNYHVPDFGAEEQGEDAFLPFRARGGLACGDELAEVLWRKGPVLRRFERSEEPPAFPRDAPGFPEEPRDLFMAEDELAAWLHQPADGAEAAGTGGTVQSPEQTQPALDPPAPPPALDSRESTAVGSSSTPALQRRTQPAPVTRDDRKRKKAWDPERSDDDDEAAEQELFDRRREGRRPAGRRSRAAEVHNLSERRRRDRINEKMRALQQLIPRCNKTDKASMLDDAVEYLKSLQLQVQQMMSMGCAMPAMMFPGMTQYPQMLMGMGSEANAGYLPCPMLPFPPVMQPPPISVASANHLGGGIPMPAFCPAPMYINQQSTGRQTGQPSDSVSSITPAPAQGQSAPQVMNVAGHHLQYLSPQQMQQAHENQTAKLEQGP